MATELREALAGLCRDHGWSYGVVWRVDPGDPRLLTVEGSYCEEQVGAIVESMLNQVYIVGKGTIGGTITNDKHEWIFHDTYSTESSTGNAEWMQQFLAGIKTILMASQPSCGVMQFGSIKKIPENLEFVDQVKRMLKLNSQKDSYLHDHRGALTSTNSSADAYISYSNSNSFDRINKASKISTNSLTGIAQASSTYTQESCYDIGFCSSSVNPYAIVVPGNSNYADASRDSCSQFQRTPSMCTSSTHCLLNQSNATSAEAENQLSSITRLLASSSCPDSSVAACFDENSWTTSIDVPMMGQEFFTELGLQELPNLVPVNSCYSVSHAKSSHQFSAGVLTSNLCGLQDAMLEMLESRSSEASKGCLSSAEKLPLPLGNLYDTNTLYYVPSSASEPINTSFANPPGLPSENSLFVHSKDGAFINLTQLHNQTSEQVACNVNVPMNKDSMGTISASSGLVESDNSCCNMAAVVSRTQFEKPNTSVVKSLGLGSYRKESSSHAHAQLFSDNDLFDGMELDIGPNSFVHEYWDDIMMPSSCSKVSEGLSDLQIGSVATSDKGLYAESGLEQLLGSIIGENAKNSAHGCVAKNLHPDAGLHLEHPLSAVTSLVVPPVYKKQASSPINLTSNILASFSKPELICGSQKGALLKTSVSSWIDDSCSRNTGNSVLNQPKKSEEVVKVVKKRARPGESTRPRPKDRQQIQDRVKELREIVPNGAKCSIDALLDRTIKHMLFLQSVTKYADKLKQADEPKMIVEDSGVVLKDNSGSGGTGGATWAYEVAGQTMVCPIIVEDLTPPGQMLVEMLCEERGFFLEIADIIRGFGLTILKGVMEIRECKIWARFLVEANREVTRMDIFLSLVQLLQQTSSIRSEQSSKVMERRTSVFPNCQQTPIAIPISLSDSAVI